MTNGTKYNLKPRIFEFVLKVVTLAKDIPVSPINKIFIGQIVRSASSIGSNYEEADGTPTKKDFIYKMGLVKKEAKETKYWLSLIRASNESRFYRRIDELLVECEELTRIFARIIINSANS